MVLINSKRRIAASSPIAFLLLILVIILILTGSASLNWVRSTATPSLDDIERQLGQLDPEILKLWTEFRLSQQNSKENRLSLHSGEICDKHSPKKVAEVQSLADIDDIRAKKNSAYVRKWRRSFEKAASIPHMTQHQDETRQLATSGYKIFNLRKCQHVFIDLGSNVGDSLHKMVDSFLPEFDSGALTRKTGEGIKLHHIFNTTTGNIGPGYYNGYKGNLMKWLLSKWVREVITEYNEYNKIAEKNVTEVFPEDYCFYGVEGNPLFTSLLRQQEINVMNMIPRPVRHIHFLTEHVAASENAPKSLYLDIVNHVENYWGSSTIRSHVDVAKSEGRHVAQVTGITLTKLLEQVTLPGGHVIIKIDIEGGEYEVLEEAINSTILCKLVRELGVRIDMLNEPHDSVIIGNEDPLKRWEEIEGTKQIEDCGIRYTTGKRQI
jgi:FkbM family methyltransferase